MKKLYFLVVSAIVVSMGVRAQSTMEHSEGSVGVIDSTGRTVLVLGNHGNESVSVSLGGFELLFSAVKKPEKKSPKGSYKGTLRLFEVGLNMLPSPDYAGYPDGEKGFLDLNNGKSFYLGMNLFNLSTPFNRSRTLGFTTGLSFVWRDYAFSEPMVPVYGEGMIHPLPLDPAPKKSKLNTFSLMIPVVLEVKNDRWFLSAGVYGDLVIGSHTKTKFPKEKARGYRYVNTFQGGVTARVGYKCLYVFGNYGLANLFKNGKGPEVRPVTLGLGFGI